MSTTTLITIGDGLFDHQNFIGIGLGKTFILAIPKVICRFRVNDAWMQVYGRWSVRSKSISNAIIN